MSSTPTMALEPIRELPNIEEFPGHLSEIPSANKTDDQPTIVKPELLSPDQTKALLERLPPLPKAETTEFKPAKQPQPVPDTKVTNQPFPETPSANVAPPQVPQASELKVLRTTPIGNDLRDIKQVTVTFNQPMVAVTSGDDALAQSVPAQLTPAIEGAWRWLDTRTLAFTPKAARLPMATAFKVEVPAGIKSANGSTLAQAFSAEFTTPPLTLSVSYPSSEGVDLQPLILLQGDQAIDIKELMPHLYLQVGNKTQTVTVASEAEIQANKTIAQQIPSLTANHWVVIKPNQPLPKSTTFTLVLAKGTKSAEGSRTTDKAQTFSFKTYGNLTITNTQCGWGDNNCQPAMPLTVELSNSLASNIDIKEWVKVEPAIEGIEIGDNYGSSFTIKGNTQPRTTYKITLKAGLTDVYGQKLAKDLSTSVKVADYIPQIAANEERFITLDPTIPPQFTFISRNFRNAKWHVQQVETKDWIAYQKLFEQWDPNSKDPIQLPGKTVAEETIPLTDKINETIIKTIDLAPWLQNGKTGQLIVVLDEGEPLIKTTTPDYMRRMRTVNWIQATQISLDTRSDNKQVLVWTAQLANGEAIPQAQVRLIQSNQTVSATTNDKGLATLTIPAPASPEDINPLSWIEAQVGNDTALLPLNSMNQYDGYRPIMPPRHGRIRPPVQSAANNWLWHVLDDRTLYQPKEQVHVKAWLRSLDEQSQLVLPETQTVNYEVFDAQDKSLAKGEVSTTALGGLDFTFDIPETVSLGDARIEFSIKDGDTVKTSFQHPFQIQEFRTPEFETKVTKASEDAMIGAANLTANAEAKYYTGGGLGNSAVRWNVNINTGTYSPPNQTDWSFGLQSAFWFSTPTPGLYQNQVLEAKTDANGLNTLQIELKPQILPLPITVNAEANISDANNQTQSASTSWLVHPAATYVGLKTDKYFVEKDQPLVVDSITTDLEGKPLAQTPVVIEAARLEWSDKQSGYEPTDIQTCEMTSNDKGLGQCTFKTPKGGQYQITATTQDKDGRRNMTRFTRWVTGAEVRSAIDESPSEKVKTQSIQLIPDKDSYKPSDTAQISIQAPFVNAQGMATVEREGVVEHYPLQLQGTSYTLSIPLKAEWMPNVIVNVVLNGTKDNKPALATGNVALKISTAERLLQLQVTPKESVTTPASETEVTVEVKQANGEVSPNTEVLVMAVDEAILALTSYQLANPINNFYPERSAGTSESYLLNHVWLSQDLTNKLVMQREMANGAMARLAKRPMPSIVIPPVAAMSNYTGSVELSDAAKSLMSTMASGGAGDFAGGASEPNQPIQARTDFNPLAAFVPSLKTDAQGKVTAKFKLPDNLTRYRIMAVAVSGADHFGVGESQLTARLPLMVRPSAPRFLNFGDEFNFPVQLQNQTDQALPVQLVLQAQNLDVPKQGYLVQVPANQRVLVQFPSKPLSAGTATYQLAAVSNDYHDAAFGQIPVQTPATNEAFATYGVIDQGAIAQPVKAPSDVWPQFGSLQVSTSSTALQSLTDAYLYLYSYPFECTEQIASRMLATLTLHDMLKAFNAPNMPTQAEVEKRLNQDIKLLLERENYEGGFALWRPDGDVFPYASLQAFHALIQAKAKGYTIPEDKWQRALEYVRNIRSLDKQEYSATTRQYLHAYSLYLMSLVNEFDAQAAQELMVKGGGASKLPTDVIAWLLPVLHNDPALVKETKLLQQALLNRVSETASGASFGDSTFVQSYLVFGSETRTNALVLNALIQTEPQSDLIPKVVKQLQARRQQGRWNNTQENAQVLVALDKYFQTFEKQTPDFVARTWLGKDYVGESSFKGRSFASSETTIPMSWLVEHPETQNLILDKQGDGRLYYRIGMNYAPKSLTLNAKNAGFEVERRYEAIDNPEDVKQNANGTWQIKAGARVKVHISLSAPATRYHVALVDPLPAGLEALNPALATTGSQAEDDAETNWYSYWFNHQNLRTNQAEAFTTELYEGNYEYSYIARATTQGTFIVPPTKAEEMYTPETFGRSSSDTVIVE